MAACKFEGSLSAKETAVALHKLNQLQLSVEWSQSMDHFSEPYAIGKIIEY